MAGAGRPAGVESCATTSGQGAPRTHFTFDGEARNHHRREANVPRLGGGPEHNPWQTAACRTSASDGPPATDKQLRQDRSVTQLPAFFKSLEKKVLCRSYLETRVWARAERDQGSKGTGGVFDLI